MSITKKLLATAAIAGGLSILGLVPAAAYVVCDRDGDDCWHTESRFSPPAGLSFTWHPDDWYFHEHWDRDRHWHDYREGRGYWRNGVWITL
jgi:hypothetical protein